MSARAPVLGCVAALLLAGAGSARAATISVTGTADTVANDGTCSLREAIIAANTDARSGAATGECPAGFGADHIVVPAGTYPLTIPGTSENQAHTGDLDITQPVTITGASAATTIVDARGIDRVFNPQAGAGAVELADLTITGGHAPDGPPGAPDPGPGPALGQTGGDATFGRGGGIANAADLTLLRCRVVNNHAGSGGRGGDATAGPSNSTGFTGQAGNGGSGADGGGIANISGTLVLDHSVLADNFAGAGGAGGTATGGTGETGGGIGTAGGGGLGGSGGGVQNDAALTAIATRFSGNVAGAGGSGGDAFGGFDVATASGTGGEAFTVSGGAGGRGGAIAGSGSLTVTSSTFDADVAGKGGDTGAAEGGTGGLADGGAHGDAGGNGGDGGAISSGAVGAQLTNVTFAANGTGAGGRGGTASGGTIMPGTGGSGGSGAAILVSSNSFAVRLATISGGLLGAGGQGGAGGAAGNPGTGGAFDTQSGTTTTAQDSILDGTCAGTVTDAGHDLTTTASGCPGAVGAADLGALGDHGGPVPTLVPGPGSGALDIVPAAGAGCTSTDARGATRPAGARCDAGAVERGAPGVTTGAATSVGVTTATLAGTLDARGLAATARFSYGTATASGASAAARVIGNALSTTLTGLKPATTYLYRVEATGTDGTSTGEVRSFRTAAAPPARDRTAPRISGLTLRPGRFRARTTAHIRLRLSEGATLSLVFSSRHRGVKVVAQGRRARCLSVRASRRVAKSQRRGRCTYYVAAGSVSRAGAKGQNALGFTGRVGKRTLTAGGYRLQVRATDAARNRSELATATFTILKARKKKR